MKLLSGFCFGFALACVGQVARACGPFFPNRYLDAGSAQLLAAPEASFVEELMRLLPPGTAKRAYKAEDLEPGPASADRTAEMDVDELGWTLREAGRPEYEVAKACEAYRAARAGGREAPEGVPTEFALYLRGAQAWKRGDLEAARAAWRAVMDLPEPERSHRAVWAAYMLGRSFMVVRKAPDPDRPFADLDEAETPREAAGEARMWFERAEALARGGASDHLGLAAEAKGWRGRLAMEAGDFKTAAALYLERLAEGDDTAPQSLRRLADRISRDTYVEEFEARARDAKTRGVVVAFLLARGASVYGHSGAAGWADPARIWAIAIRRAGGSEVPGADRLAWLAYEGGLFGLAGDWLAVAPADSPEAAWLRAKLALRAGNAAEGAAGLERALRLGGLTEAQQDLALAELGRVRLAKDEPAEALRAFLGGGHWEDAAYVAERVLSADELRAVVDAGPELEGRDPGEMRRLLRGLLARRLARENRETEALRYFPAETRERFAVFRADIETGFDDKLSAARRAEVLWRAARALRESGLEWVGTELEPDWAIHGGSYDEGSAAVARMTVPKWEGGVFAPTEAERTRVERHAAPERRFHYRYQAAELAWWAASLMPDQTEETARVLWEAGGWLKARDPKAAEPFYRAMVLRCGKTTLGREAARLRWFPKEADGAPAK